MHPGNLSRDFYQSSENKNLQFGAGDKLLESKVN